MKTIRPLIAALLFACAPAWAALTDDQMLVLKGLAAADPVAQTYFDGNHDGELAAWFNTSDATYTVWRSSVTDREIHADTGFDWTRVDNLSTGKARIWEYMFKFGSINPSQPNVRAGIAAAWVGTAADLAVQAVVMAKCKRLATRAEKALASGSGTTLSPSVMGFEGSISPGEASTIRSL